MPKYEQLLQESRAKGEPIGPAHHKADKQFKVWLAKKVQKIENRNQLAAAREAKSIKSKLREAEVSINKAREKIANLAKNPPKFPKTEDELRELQAQENRKKLADGYKSIVGDVSHVKSVGNGL